MYDGDNASSSEWPNLNEYAATPQSQPKPSSAVDWTFGVKEDRSDGRRETRFLPPEPGEKLILDPPEEPPISYASRIGGGDLGGRSGGGGASGKVKIKSFGYQRTESSIHGSMAHGNVKKVNGQLVNDFTPTLQQAMAEKPGQTSNPHLVRQFQTGIKMPVSALCEWGSQSRNRVDFREVAVAKENMRKGSFACVAITNGFQHDQGVGRTKKEAKHRAASIAFCNLYKLDHPPDDDPANYKKNPSVVNTAGSQIFPKDKIPDTFPSWNSSNMSDQGFVDMEQRRWCQAEMQSETTCDDRSNGTGYVPPHLQNLASSGGPPPGFESDDCLTDADVVYKKFETKISVLKGTLDKQLASRVSTNWAAFLVQRENADAADSEVVAVGAGCGHISNEPDRDTNGSLLHDSHAVVLARRSFLRYLYKNYDDAVSNSEAQKQQSILVLGRSCATSQSTSYIARLKEGVQIHVCMSTSPCGEAFQRSFKEDKDRRLTQKDIDTILSGDHACSTDTRNCGKVHVKQRGLETVCATDNVTRQAFESVSCADKIFKWNVLGVQGTLLSYFMEPIYITSFNIGSKFVHTHFVNSTCCRGASSPELAVLKEPYCLNHPFVGRTTLSRAKDVDFSENANNNTKIALNWYSVDDRVELTDPSTGMVIDESPFKSVSHKTFSRSRICKNAFWFRFMCILKKLRWVKEADPNNKFTTYQGSKELAAGMVAAKRVFETAINSAGKGRWSEAEIKRGMLYFSK